MNGLLMRAPLTTPTSSLFANGRACSLIAPPFGAAAHSFAALASLSWKVSHAG